jgi:hypothetical protein
MTIKTTYVIQHFTDGMWVEWALSPDEEEAFNTLEIVRGDDAEAHLFRLIKKEIKVEVLPYERRRVWPAEFGPPRDCSGSPVEPPKLAALPD